MISTRTPLDTPALTPIPQVQGSGDASPYAGATISIAGVVTGIQRTGAGAGFYLQDPTGDGDALTSDGMFVRMGDTSTTWQAGMQLGARATATGVVSEKSGVTALDVASTQALKLSSLPGAGGLQPQELVIPVDPGERAQYLEAREGMLVGLGDALVVGPTNGWGQYVAVDAKAQGARRMGSTPDVTGFVHVNGKLGPKPQLVVGDRVTGIKGPLGVSAGTFEVLPTGNYKELLRGPRPPRAFGDIDGDDRFTDVDRGAIQARLGTPAASPLDPADLNGDGQVTRADLNRLDDRITSQGSGPVLKIATLNAENFFDPDDAPAPIDDDVPSSNQYQTKLAKLAGTVRDRLGTPDLLALEEVENTRVLDDLLARPELAGLGYQYVLLPTSGRRSINPALLYRTGSASVLDARQAQKAIRGGEESIYADPATTHSSARASKAPLFAREPLIVDLKLAGAGAGQELTLVVNHLVSKFSPHGVPTDTTRVEQAEFLRDTVTQLRTDHPEREVVVLGDMNDTPGSRSLNALTGPKRTPTLINTTATMVPEAERYSYLYEGRSELIDHILVTPGLQAQVDRTGVRHGNADLPIGDAWDSGPQRASDHDSPYLWLRLGEQPATPKPQTKP